MTIFNHNSGSNYTAQVIVALGLVCCSALTHGANFLVTNTESTGIGSLAYAIYESEMSPGADTISFDNTVFSSQQSISLIGKQTINEDLIINGPGKNLLTIESQNIFDRELFNIDVPASAAHLRTQVELNNLTISMHSGNDVARTIFARNANLTLDKVNLVGDGQTLEDQSGSAIAIVDGSLTLKQCQIENFNARYRGGAIFANYPSTLNNAYTININQCALVNNKVIGGKSSYPVDGGALYVSALAPSNQVYIRIENSEFSDNQAQGDGGAIMVLAADLDINNSTISGNQAKSSGGAIWFNNPTPQFGRSFYIMGSTITQNQSNNIAGGIMTYDYNQNIVLSSSVIAGNSAPNDPEIAFGDIVASYSLIGDDLGDSDKIIITEHRSAIGTVLLDVNPMLSALANNGGVTRTHAIQAGSPLIDAGNDHPLPTTPNFVPAEFDQRGNGFPRTQGTNPDIGAYEFKPSVGCNNCGGGTTSGGGGGSVYYLLLALALMCLSKSQLLKLKRSFPRNGAQ